MRPSLAQAHDELDDVAPLRRVEAVEGLVEQQQLGVVGERLGQLHALAHAVGEAAQLPVRDVGQADLAERPRPPRRRGRATPRRRAQRATIARAVRKGQSASRSWAMPIRR